MDPQWERVPPIFPIPGPRPPGRSELPPARRPELPGCRAQPTTSSGPDLSAKRTPKSFPGPREGAGERRRGLHHTPEGGTLFPLKPRILHFLAVPDGTPSCLFLELATQIRLFPHPRSVESQNQTISRDVSQSVWPVEGEGMERKHSAAIETVLECHKCPDRATNPLNKELNWASINGFCEQLNEDFEGPPLATRLLAHKIQSPQEWEAVQALTVLETCMKSCGKRFHDEVGKFRFLNELIKVVSPKYLGSRTSEKVKNKILELLYSWTVGLPEEVKIAEAYQMLKKQGIVKADPKLPDDAAFPVPPPRPKNVIFEDEEKSKMLARLLKSSHPEDLRAANKLIKEMVQEDQKRMEKISKRASAIEEVNNNVKLLTEMVMNHSQGGAAARSSEDLMKELYQRCERMRPTLFRLASDTEDNDEALAEILQANDNLTQVINLYKQLVRGEEVNGDATTASIPGSTSALLDLSGLDLPPTGTTYPAVPTRPGDQASPEQPSTSVSLLDDELMSLGLGDPTPLSGLDGAGWNSFQSSDGMEASAPTPAPSVDSGPPAQTSPPASSGLDDLDLLGKTLLQQSLPPESQQVRWEKQQPAPRLTLRDLQNKSSCNLPSSSAAGLLHSVSPEPPGPPQQPTPTELSLANITVPLESIKPSSILPVTVYDQHGFRVLFHFARDPLPGRSDVLVVVVSMLSTAPQPIRNIVFQSAVPKVMKVKLQPPSGTELPAFNPIVHPSAITQVLLLANPQKEKVRLRYKLLFTMGDQTYNEMGDVDQFPPPETWGSL